MNEFENSRGVLRFVIISYFFYSQNCDKLNPYKTYWQTDAYLSRSDAVEGLDFLGIKMDVEKNNCRGVEKVISADDSKVKVLLVPTDEEIVIARDTQELVMAAKK